MLERLRRFRGRGVESMRGMIVVKGSRVAVGIVSACMSPIDCAAHDDDSENGGEPPFKQSTTETLRTHSLTTLAVASRRVNVSDGPSHVTSKSSTTEERWIEMEESSRSISEGLTKVNHSCAVGSNRRR